MKKLSAFLDRDSAEADAVAALRERRLALVFALFSAVSSLDMTAMGLASMGLLTAPSLLRLILQRRAMEEWVWPVIRISTAADDADAATVA